LLHRAACECAVIKNVLVLIAVAVTAGEMHAAGVAVLRESTAGRAAVIVRDAIGIGVRVMVAGGTHLETVAIAGRERAVVVGLATRHRHCRTGLPEIVAVIRVLMRIAILQNIARSRSELDVNAVSILPLRGWICVIHALTILNRIILGTGSLDLDACIGVAGRDTGIDHAAGDIVEVNPRMVHARHGQAVEAHVIAGNEAVARAVEVERCRTGHRDPGGDVALPAHAIRTGDVDRLAGFGGLNGVDDVRTRNSRGQQNAG